MRGTRRKNLTLGLLLIVVAIFVLEQGPQVLSPIAGGLGLETHYQAEVPILSPTLISIPPTNYTFLSAALGGNGHVDGSVEVADGREIAFYVMNEGNFSQWRAGRPSAVVFVRASGISYNFTFPVPASGTYYFVFDNQDTSRRVITFRLNAVEDVTVLSPIVQFAGYEILAIGIVFSLVGVKGGGRKPEPRTLKVGGWECKFCRAENAGDQIFCESCGRSQQ